MSVVHYVTHSAPLCVCVRLCNQQAYAIGWGRSGRGYPKVKQQSSSIA